MRRITNVIRRLWTKFFPRHYIGIDLGAEDPSSTMVIWVDEAQHFSTEDWKLLQDVTFAQPITCAAGDSLEITTIVRVK